MGNPWYISVRVVSHNYEVRWFHRIAIEQIHKILTKSNRNVCYKQQQYSKLLVYFVFKVSAFRNKASTKTHVQLPNCRLNNALIKFVSSCLDTRTQLVDVLNPFFVDFLHY